MIDIFAGPGGLSEVFSRYSDWFGDQRVCFQSVLSIEKDETAVRTLTLRAFYRQFNEELPSEYWSVLRGEASMDVLSRFPEWKAAERHVWEAELGKIPINQLHGRIEQRLKGADDWLLIGGPPCQAYSLIGRARMTGIGFAAKGDAEAAELARLERLRIFHGDVRHVLYREYLRIIAVHQPTAFVMENVKGILSAKLPGAEGNPQFMVDRIREDLPEPWFALEDDEDTEELKAVARPGRPRYRLHALTADAADLWSSQPANSDFLIKSEEFGVPQKRHRVIVVGIREDHPGVPETLRRARPASVRDALGHLPPVRSGLSRGKDTESEWLQVRRASAEALLSADLPETAKEIVRSLTTSDAPRGGRGVNFARSLPGLRQNTVLDAWLCSPQPQGYPQHESRPHMPSDLQRYLYVAAVAAATGKSPKLEQWPAELLPKHKNVGVNEDGIVEASGFADRFKVQVWDEPSSTVTSHIAKDGHYFIHPDPGQNRSLTVREAARLQTFPDDYYFCGNRTQQYHQVGNAVPPLLAVQLARCVAVLFGAAKAEEVTREEMLADG